MKVLFAVNNEEISETIIKRYQRNYKEIISCKNVYYFNAIIKELQKDKSYDRIVISEELEAFTHKQYEQIDKFIFDKLDNISDEAINTKGNDIPIILICSDRRTKSEQFLVKLFGISVYNALLGNDRSIENVCKLINKPRVKKEAKQYYQIGSEEVDYKPENENEVSEIEIQNILAHYKRLGRDEKKYVESFNNIASQYNDIQLKIIINYLPVNVKEVLEEESPKYQQLTAFSKNSNNTSKKTIKEPQGTTERLLKSVSIKRNTNPFIIPSAVNKTGSKKVSKTTTQPTVSAQPKTTLESTVNTQPRITPQPTVSIQPKTTSQPKTIEQSAEELQTKKENIKPTYRKASINNDIQTEKEKRGRGRPRKNKNSIVEEKDYDKPKRGRGRPPKKLIEEDDLSDNKLEETILPGINEFNSDINNTILPGLSDFDSKEEDTVLPGLNDFDSKEDTESPKVNEIDTTENILPGFEFESTHDDETILPGLEQFEEILPEAEAETEEREKTHIDNRPMFQINHENEELYNNYDNNQILPGFEEINTDESINQSESLINENDYINKKEENKIYPDVDLTNLLTSDKKIAIFVGTSKNGTSFIVNSLAEFTSSLGINTAILDTTQNRNAYYIYTNNEDNLRNIAQKNIEYLTQGIAEGIRVNNNLTVYPSIPNEETEIENAGVILETLVKNHSLILIDSDFNTPSEYFRKAQEIYLVQSYDILTIQALTEFLKGLKYKNILDERKIRVILNKTVKIRSVNENLMIGGMANYNDPTMSTMIDLFDKDKVNYINIPFDEEVYARYLEGIINCNISIKKYSKSFLQVLKELSNMVYPTFIGGKTSYKPPQVENNAFSPSINSTLNQMKNRY